MTGEEELEDRTATYVPEIDQSQHAKLASHIITSYADPEPAHSPKQGHINYKDPNRIQQRVDAKRHDEARDDVGEKVEQPLYEPREDDEGAEDDDVGEGADDDQRDLLARVQQGVLVVQVDRVWQELKP